MPDLQEKKDGGVRPIPDVQSQRDTRRVAIDRVGVTNVSYPIVVLDQKEATQHTVATVTMAVSLPHDYRGTHMSRFIEVLDEFQGRVTISNLEHIAENLRVVLEAEQAEIVFSFPYFIMRKAPATGMKSYTRYDVSLSASKGQTFDLVTTVVVPVQTLCPCSKEISEGGAHNQRAYVEIAVRMKGLVWIEELVEVAERSASAPVYTLLKREDEKFVTEQAYNTPRFVEDVLREVALALEGERRITWYRIRVTSNESIHNHDAFASLERDKAVPGPQEDGVDS
ncbi:MAG TPA: GTP cyclohydrolase I FolE2 [Synergistaceae bacterium]|nr:GTP cyclohydrolase I FolE2 [Synergistaceae bacterium]